MRLLRKVLEVGSLRWIGKHYSGLSPQELPIASVGTLQLEDSTGGKCYAFGRFNPTNAIILKINGLYYAYVNPKYSGYRGFFKSLIKHIPNGFDIDHVLARNIAKKLNYSYVLLCAIPSGVNKKHGYYERFILSEKINDVCFGDERIYNKVLSRNPLVRYNKELLLKGFSAKVKPQYGLTLKQAGLWHSAFCLHLADVGSIDSRTKCLELVANKKIKSD